MRCSLNCTISEWAEKKRVKLTRCLSAVAELLVFLPMVVDTIVAVIVIAWSLSYSRSLCVKAFLYLAIKCQFRFYCYSLFYSRRAITRKSSSRRALSARSPARALNTSAAHWIGDGRWHYIELYYTTNRIDCGQSFTFKSLTNFITFSKYFKKSRLSCAFCPHKLTLEREISHIIQSQSQKCLP